MQLASVRLKKNEDKRILQGHLWVYSNEIDTQHCSLSQYSLGQLVDLEDSRGKFLGRGYINPHTLLCARILTKNPVEDINQMFLVTRIKKALELRQKLFTEPYYRLIFGESDFLPGLIVDRYHDLLVVQITTAGMENLLALITEALVEVVKPAAILLRNDHGMRKQEGLDSYVRPAWGEPPQQCQVKENGVSFLISPWIGQKTGWFFDHRENRQKLQRFVQGKRVLDVFTYVGAWAVQAAVWGAEAVVAVDSSASALSQCKENAHLNQVESRLVTHQGDAFDSLKEYVAAKEKFDIVILDPPAFIKKRKDHNQGMIAYKRINQLALQLLAAPGLLITASCSQHLSADELQQAVLSASLSSGVDLQILAHGHQGMDHPIHPAIPETEYLKALFLYNTKGKVV